MMVITGGRAFSVSGLSSLSSSSFSSLGTLTEWAALSRFSVSKRMPCLAQILTAASASMVWVTVAKTPICMRSPMIWKGFLPICSANSRTTMGGRMMMVGASAAN